MRINMKLGDKFFNVATLGEYKVVEETSTTFYLACFGTQTDVLRVDNQMTHDDFSKQYQPTYKTAVLQHIVEKQRVIDSLRLYYNTIQD